ncbi:Gfo/Idh/MocA family oxidoreductase [soil metagenome]
MNGKADAPKLRWGIIGPGNIARYAIAPAIRYSSNGRLLIIGSREPVRAAAIALETEAETSVGSYEALLKRDDVDAVYIGLPNGLHEEWTIAAAKAGKHVLCEKSLTLTEASALRMRAACAKANVLLMEAFMYRHHPQWIRVRDLLNEGAIGQVRSISAHLCGNLTNGADHRWSTELGGGALHDVTCYGINMARYLTGAEPISVKASAELVKRGVDRTSHAVLEFPGGILANVHGSLSSYGSQGLCVYGTDGMLMVEKPVIPGFEPTMLYLHRESRVEPIQISGANHFLHQVEHFAACVADGKLQYPAEDGVANVAACEKAQKSWEGK